MASFSAVARRHCAARSARRQRRATSRDCPGRVDAESCAQTRELSRPSGRRDVLGNKAVRGEIVAKHHDQVTVECIAGVNHLRTRPMPILGPPACKLVMTVTVRRRPFGQFGGESR